MALEAVEGERTRAERAQRVDAHPDLITRWRARLLGGASGVLGAAPAPAVPAVEVEVVHAKIGGRAWADDLLEGALGRAGLSASARR